MSVDAETRDRLIQEATAAREASYSPYSKYKVGAAVLTKSGRVYRGCNIENAAYTPSVCAERTAIFKAISEGERDFLALAVVTENGGAPCGVCRQVMREFAPQLTIINADLDGQVEVYSLPEVLPHSFGPEDLA
ncbi:MAG: cytidine deaminase [Anaerolineae bacterium]